MNLYALLQARTAARGPVRVGLIGAGKFGSMFLAQVPHTAGVEVSAIADLDPDRASAACRTVGWHDEHIASVNFSDDATVLIDRDDVDVVVEATGSPQAGIAHARKAIAARKPVVMVSVEADVLAGPLLAKEAADAGVVYSMAYGDQPALICELVDWARACGMKVVAAGKGTKYLPEYHSSTPETVWDYYGLSAEEADAGGMNAQMFNSFLDGTKSAIEMAAVVNAAGLTAPPAGLGFPLCSADDLPRVLCPEADGGVLSQAGTVEVISSLERDSRVVERDLRWGVYVVFEAPTSYTTTCFREYGLLTDASGRYAALYRPYHLIGMELNISILSAALRGEATGAATGFRGDVVANAKRDLAAGELLDGEGGACVWGKLLPAGESIAIGGLPIGLAHGIKLTNDVAAGQLLTWDDVTICEDDETYQYRRRMEEEFGSP